MSTTRSPTVSVVIATYNRSRCLRLAIGSVLAQTFSDFELIVVGDACTDDSAAVVSGFDDSRVRWVNLGYPVGEQSGPNNVGVALARAPLVAFLNHDDLWVPDHLQSLVEGIRVTGADLVFSAALSILPANSDSGDDFPVVVDAFPADGRYDPAATSWAIPASTWLVTRDLHQRIGGWRPARECRIEPSQDFLFRAHRGHARIRGRAVPTVLAVHSGLRDGSYVGNRADRQEWLAARLTDPLLIADLLSRDARAHSGLVPDRSGLAGARSAVWTATLRAASAVGFSGRAIDVRVRRGLSRGELIDRLHVRRGLPADRARPPQTVPQLRRQAALQLETACDAWHSTCRGGWGAALLVSGWSWPEPIGTWTDGPIAELALRPVVHRPDEAGTGRTGPPGPPGRVRLRIGARALRPGVSVRAATGGLSWTWAVGTEPGEYASPPVAVDPTGAVSFRFEITGCASPHDLGMSPDARHLGMLVDRLRVDAEDHP